MKGLDEVVVGWLVVSLTGAALLFFWLKRSAADRFSEDKADGVFLASVLALPVAGAVVAGLVNFIHVMGFDAAAPVALLLLLPTGLLLRVFTLRVRAWLRRAAQRQPRVQVQPVVYPVGPTLEEILNQVYQATAQINLQNQLLADEIRRRQARRGR
jgi:hypothetical protein